MAHKGKILLVDDDRLVLAALTHGLASVGYEVIDADNGDDAILLAREHQPDVALLDIRMEGRGGFDVAAYLRDYGQIPFIFLSTFSDEDSMLQVKALGAAAYLVKPLDIRQVVLSVEAALVQAEVRVTAMGDVLGQPVAMAVGVLMHRYSLSRTVALERLCKMAADDSHTLPQQAERILEALELLSRPGEA